MSPKNTKRIIILVGVVSSIFLAVLPTILESPPVQELISGNITLQNFVEVTKQPMWWNIFVPLAVFVIVGLTYLWIRAGKPERNKDIEELKREIVGMRADIRALVNKNRKSHSGKRTKRDNQA